MACVYACVPDTQGNNAVSSKVCGVFRLHLHVEFIAAYILHVGLAFSGCGYAYAYRIQIHDTCMHAAVIHSQSTSVLVLVIGNE